MKDLVFIVEDNLVQQKALRAHFEEVLNNYSVKTFPTPVDLIKNLKAKPFAVVLDHFFGPGEETGLHYLKEIRAKYPKVPIIYHTTCDENAIREQVMALGAQQYILKDSASYVRLRTVLDVIHDKSKKEKKFWSTWFSDSFAN